MPECIFVFSLFLIIFTYFGYPFSLVFISVFRKKTVTRIPEGDYYPTVSFIITAYNEEKNIKQKLENTLSLQYPMEKLQIVVASDGSTDQTNRIVEGFREKGVELIALPVRRGKENAQKQALLKTTGEIIVFTDAATILETGALNQIVSNFFDPTIGCVSSEDKIIGTNGQLTGEGSYVEYEMWLRRLESNVNSIVGLSGSFFAVRSSVCKDFSGEMQSDFRTLLSCVKSGYRGISDPLATGYYRDVQNVKNEFDRKIRTILRGLTVFFRHIEMLNVFRYGLFSYQLFCHKLLRWLIPIFFILILVTSFALSFQSKIFFVIFIFQIIIYLIAIIGWNKRLLSSNILFKIPVYFVAVNVSIMIAWVRYLKGQRVIMWSPTER